MQALCWILAAIVIGAGAVFGLNGYRYSQRVDYAVLNQKYSLEDLGVPGLPGYTDKAQFIFHMRSTAYLFGEHEGRTLVVEFLTSGFFLRFRLEQTAPELKVCGAYSEYAPPGCTREPGHGGEHYVVDQNEPREA